MPDIVLGEAHCLLAPRAPAPLEMTRKPPLPSSKTRERLMDPLVVSIFKENTAIVRPNDSGTCPILDLAKGGDIVDPRIHQCDFL